MIRPREETDYEEAEALKQNSKKSSQALKNVMEARNKSNPQALKKTKRKK